ncbi:ADP-ribosylglycohydrolase family protein [Planotetraspora phitsanulokensis]|nr:ADP-ribosylglycohydrolase family protein [Planotetraspora phitsanulokensis]
MLWAAWADALGFITELTDDVGLRRRLSGKPLVEPVEWKRRVGGRFGVEVALPAGCYSDDTQLRLATSRSIQNRGFDIEAFTQVEMTVWPSYALGGGRASKAAAVNLARPGVPWFGNFYDGWENSGGNGVAMRIQPHIWAAPQPAILGPHILDVLINAIATHGHPRALVGAVLHAVALGVTLHEGHVPGPERWPELLHMCEQSVKLVDDHSQLSTVWRPQWERTVGSSFSEAWHQTIRECRVVLPELSHAVVQLKSKIDLPLKDQAQLYDTITEILKLRDPSHRGSGITTVLAAMAIAAAFPDPARAALLSANALGTDTDTIATMAGALIGATDAVEAPDPEHVLDSSYLIAEARKLAEIASGKTTKTFSYPDLLHWSPPRTQLDAVGTVEGRPALAGLSWLEPLEGTDSPEKKDAVWSWVHSDFGASFLAKHRPRLRELPTGNRPVRRVRNLSEAQSEIEQLPLASSEETRPTEVSRSPNLKRSTIAAGRADIRDDKLPSESVDVDQMLKWVAHENFSDRAVGYAVKRIAALGTVEQLTAFTSTLRYALRSRRHRS